MKGFVDLHCHWLPAIDDGAKSWDDGLAMLRGLHALGFSHVVATPHMRPGLFDNEKPALVESYERASRALANEQGVPEVSLGSEHYFDDRVLGALRRGEGLPYAKASDPRLDRRSGGLLIEFHDLTPPQTIERQLFELQTLGYVPVIAHPERYRAVWSDPKRLERLLDLGSTALLDVAAVVGKYGREAERAAKKLLELGLYDAACSDAHRPGDLDPVERGMRWIEVEYGTEELDFLLGEAPGALLDGRRPA